MDTSGYVQPQLADRFEAAIKEFLEYRAEYGGILLPNSIMVEDAFREAMYRTGMRKRPEPPKPIPILGRKGGAS